MEEPPEASATSATPFGECCWCCWREPAGEAYNVGNDEEVSIGDVARIAAGLESPDLPIRFETSQDRDYLSDNPQRRCPNLTKLKQLGGWVPEVKVREGLARTLRSYREASGASE